MVRVRSTCGSVCVCLVFLACLGSTGACRPSERAGGRSEAHDAAPSRCPDAETLASLGAPDEPRGPWVARAADGELFLRTGARLDVAPAFDLAVLRSYPATGVRGRTFAGRRATLLAAPGARRVGEELRVVHVLEITAPGDHLYVMGPEPVLGEWVDGALVTAPVPREGGAFQPLDYDGAVLASPGLDFNFVVTSYRFDRPGIHHVQWRAGDVISNILCVDVTP